jgi:hypothetical protein
MRTRARVCKFKKHNPRNTNTLTDRVVADLSGLEKAVNS